MTLVRPDHRSLTSARLATANQVIRNLTVSTAAFSMQAMRHGKSLQSGSLNLKDRQSSSMRMALAKRNWPQLERAQW